MWPIEPRVRSLSGFQLSRIDEFEERWCRLATSLEESNRNLVEGAARRLYVALGEPMPPVFWVRSPDELRLARLLRLAEQRSTPRPRKPQLWTIDWPLRMLWEPLLRDYLTASGEMTANAWGPIEVLAIAVADRLAWTAMKRFELEIDRATDGMLEAHGWPGQFFGTMAALDFTYSLVMRDLAPARSLAVIDLFRHCGTCLPDHDACWLVERPAVIVTNSAGRLHCETGPAIVYRDGWGAFYLDGHWVPEHVVTRPADITLEDIALERRGEAREVMIRRYGIARYLTDSGAVVVSRDEFGTLFRLEAGAARSGRQIVRVVDATAGKDGARKEYFLQVPMKARSAREAVAWSFWLAEMDYAPNLET